MPTSTAPSISDAIMSSVKQGQELVLDGISTWTDFAGKLFTVPKSYEALPFADAFPSPGEMMNTGFDLAGELLAAQKDFTVKLLDVVTPKAS